MRGEGRSGREIAVVLNREGYRAPRGAAFTKHIVSRLFAKLGLTAMRPVDEAQASRFKLRFAETDPMAASWAAKGQVFCARPTEVPPQGNDAASYLKSVQRIAADSGASTADSRTVTATLFWVMNLRWRTVSPVAACTLDQWLGYCRL